MSGDGAGSWQIFAVQAHLSIAKKATLPGSVARVEISFPTGVQASSALARTTYQPGLYGSDGVHTVEGKRERQQRQKVLPQCRRMVVKRRVICDAYRSMHAATQQRRVPGRNRQLLPACLDPREWQASNGAKEMRGRCPLTRRMANKVFQPVLPNNEQRRVAKMNEQAQSASNSRWCAKRSPPVDNARRRRQVQVRRRTRREFRQAIKRSEVIQAVARR